MNTDARAGRWQRWFWNLFPLVWLVYLLFPISEYISHPHPLGQEVLAALGLAVFLASWIWVYGASVRQRHHLWRLAFAFGWCLLLYTAGFSVIGYAAVTFLIYAASIAGFQASARITGYGVLVAAAGIFTPMWLGHAVTITEALTYVVFAGVAATGNHAGYRQFLYRTRLAQVQAEKERLAAGAERERIARDLHDLLGHTLSVIVLKSELAARLAERNPQQAVQEIREVERISREALSEVRSAVRGYRGSGLNAELGRSKVALDAAGVRLEYEGEPLTLPPAVEYVMEMVLREAVTNVVRHAHARRCHLRVGQVGDCYELEVRDDGVGGSGPEGSGLTGMRERVRALGGDLTRETRGGTRLLVRLPTRTDASAGAPGGAVAPT